MTPPTTIDKNMSSLKRLIDPHLHLFNLEQGEYAWLKPENSPFWEDKALIRKNTLEQDLSINNGIELQAYVHIEAGFDNCHPSKELDWLNQHCQMPYKAISYVDISQACSGFSEQIEQLSQYQSFVGIRDIIDDGFVKKLDLNNAQKNLQYLAKRGFIFELQVDFGEQDHVCPILDILSSTTQLSFSINHAGFAPYHDVLAFEKWKTTLKQFAEFTNSVVKVSGLEMTSRQYSTLDLRLVLEAACEVLGQERVMMASNFPLLALGRLVSSNAFEDRSLGLNYSTYWQSVFDTIDALNLDSDKLCYQNARQFYRFSDRLVPFT